MSGHGSLRPGLRHLRVAVCGIGLSLVGACAPDAQTGTTRPSAPAPLAATAPSDQPMDPGTAGWWAAATAPLKGEGVLRGEVWTVTLPRDDLWVQSELGDVPADAGIDSEFHFWRCPCGHAYVLGSFVLPDYEANDVSDALRGGHLTVASMAPVMMTEKPRLLCVRFQGEGAMDDIVSTLKNALGWTGPARTATQPVGR